MSNTCPILSIVTVNYNGLADTRAMIQSVMSHLQDLSFEIIVVDNASRNDEASQLQSIYADNGQVRVIASPENRGFAGGNNIGIREAQGEYILLLNNDTYIKDDGFSGMIQWMRQHPQVGMLSPLLIYASDEHTIQYAGFTPLSSITLRNKGIGHGEPNNGQYAAPYRTAFAHGAALLFPKKLLETIGYMPENYFLYYEEMDWCASLTRKGYEIWVDPRCVVYHLESRSTKADSPLKIFYMTRNRLVYASRNLTIPNRWLSYIYQCAIVAPIVMCRHLIHRRADLARATWQGIVAFVNLNTQTI